MKTILFYDSETTGLPLWSQPSEHPDQPHITQLAAELCVEATGETLRQMSLIVRPDGYTIPDEVAELTGITTELALAEGIEASAVLHQFLEMWKDCDQRAGHNESFDMRILRIAIMRDSVYNGMFMPDSAGVDVPFADYWKAAPAYCTQANSTRILNLPPTPKMVKARRFGPKSPNLSEAYEFFTGKKLDGAHNALVDVAACKAVYYGIKAHQAQAVA